MSQQLDVWHKDLVKDKNPILKFWSEVFAIVELEWKKIRKEPIEIVLRAIQPILWLVLFGQVFSQIRGIPTNGATYIEFLTPGILAQSITFLSIFYGLNILLDRDSGLMQKYFSSPIYRSAFILGKMFSASLRALGQLVIIIVIALVLGVNLDLTIVTIIGVIFTVILGSAFFAGLSIFIACHIRSREGLMGFGQLITMPLFFASNALYPISIMPGWLQEIAIVNPMSYTVDALRGFLLTTHTPTIILDFGILLCAVILILFASTKVYPKILN
ncbi:multidrug ABC transporter permease [Anaerobacillus alkalidiazotrophicus]|uniref:Transport permease protein n=1 Tax=Anaerobacillus alkalidiazotrophicus TaxID=472963 RepID=A0A1S2M332_9BACI|nr:ABC transporter permease [Anaerobacillus alkalidiazotrophicus]OIJ19044.1 multidrug ABC transporter permease [Anaerobacillus alkalidiazotrophicus]